MMGEEKQERAWTSKSLYQIDDMREVLDTTCYDDECWYFQCRLGYIHAYSFDYNRDSIWA